jgi:hypothetical protein
MKVPCEDCAVDAPEKISSMIQNKTELFKRGWHVHRASGGFKGTVFEDGEQFVTFMDDELFYKSIGKLYEVNSRRG